VKSVNGKKGDVTLAFSDITGTLPTHTHSGGDITSKVASSSYADNAGLVNNFSVGQNLLTTSDVNFKTVATTGNVTAGGSVAGVNITASGTLSGSTVNANTSSSLASATASQLTASGDIKTTSGSLVFGKSKLLSARNRLEIMSSSDDTKIAVGYLGGIDGRALDSTDFGIWFGAGNAIVIDNGTASQFNGDWIVQHDANVSLVDSGGNEVIRLGTTASELGLFLKNSAGTVLSKFTSGGAYFGNNVCILADGSGQLTDGITWTQAGELTVNAAKVIGTLSAAKVKAEDVLTGILAAGNANVRLNLGQNNIAVEKYSTSWAPVARFGEYDSNKYGLWAIEGNIGGWSVNSSSLSNGNI